MQHRRSYLKIESPFALFLVDRITAICLFFLLAGIPLIINPFAYDYWYKPKIDSVYGLLIILWITLGIRIIVFKYRLQIKSIPLLLPLIAYGIASILSTIFSISPNISIHGDIFREEGIYTIFSYIALTVIFATAIHSKQQLQHLLIGLLVSAFIVSAYALIQYLGYNPTQHFIPLLRSFENRAGSTLGNPNFLGKFLVLVIPFSIVYYLSCSRTFHKFLFLMCIITLILALIVTYTRASWLSCAFSVGLLAYLLRDKIPWNRQKQGIIIIFVLTVMFCFEILSIIKREGVEHKKDTTIIERIVSTFDLQEGGLAGRLYLWEKAILIIKDRPFLGYGLDTHAKPFAVFNLEYSRKFKCSGLIDRAHNNYLDIAIAQGIIGLAAYLCIILRFMIWLLKTMKAENHSETKFFYYASFAACCGYLLNDFFSFSVVSVSPIFWSLMGLTISVKRLQELDHSKA